MSVAAKRYATALMDVLYPEAEAGLHQLQNFASLFADQPDARRFLENPAMAGDRRNRLLKEISDALGFDRRVANFVNILSDRGRLPLLEEIIDEYQTLLDQRMGIARARYGCTSIGCRPAARVDRPTGTNNRKTSPDGSGYRPIFDRRRYSADWEHGIRRLGPAAIAGIQRPPHSRVMC